MSDRISPPRIFDGLIGDVCLEKFRSAEAAAPTFRYDGLCLRAILSQQTRYAIAR
ncbi:MAG: hypothetical protein RMX68_008535 [Aulosira sp. ZfuVER01]|nr:hypothetical protein [Aulosira sp. ZfuVER01]MDZ7997411.1 hypothetical protein [Aulosira sp. DedVER01a]MDZ8054560.1 hypothetical protein [Aulosira sp. ZfuCHP01]